eukprot:2439780-Prymnesium_polylepis.1
MAGGGALFDPRRATKDGTHPSAEPEGVRYQQLLGAMVSAFLHDARRLLEPSSSGVAAAAATAVARPL